MSREGGAPDGISVLQEEERPLLPLLQGEGPQKAASASQGALAGTTPAGPGPGFPAAGAVRSTCVGVVQATPLELFVTAA